MLKTKKKCLDTAQASLRAGNRVIIDATNKDRQVQSLLQLLFLFCGIPGSLTLLVRWYDIDDV